MNYSIETVGLYSIPILPENEVTTFFRHKEDIPMEASKVITECKEPIVINLDD